jgi:collagen triple helix repeat protein
MRYRPSPALVISCLALLVSLSGTGIAAVNALPRGSVGPAQLQTGAVNSLKVKDASLKLLDFAATERTRLKGDPGPAGPQGAKGDRGDKGDKGTKGDTGAPGAVGVSNYQVVEKTQSTTAGFMGVSVNCPAGLRPLGGGGGTATPGAGVSVRNSFPTPSGWLVVVEATKPGSGWSYEVDAVCAKVS